MGDFLGVRCKNCRFWLVDEEDYRASEIMRPFDLDTDAPMKLSFEVKHCTHPKITFYERPLEDDGATVVDSSQYYARLMTAPNFGCALGEERAHG